MADDVAFQHINEAKVNLDEIYNQPDPRGYFRALKSLNYEIPGTAKPIFQKLIGALRERGRDPVRILDLGCSYGVNAALLKYDLAMSELYEHWGREQLAGASTAEIIASDRRYFTELDEVEDIEMVGFDQAENAIDFAEDVGLLNHGFAANLETQPLPASVDGDLSEIDLVVSTGCIGYVTERTFKRLLPALTRGPLPWMANFVLRMFPFDPIDQTLSEHGFVTEKLDGHTFVQRRFASEAEQKRVLGQLQEQGIDPAGKESEGHLIAEFYLSRPSREAARTSLEELVLA